MKDDKKQAEKLTELLKGAEDHPLIKQLFAEKAAAVLASRKTAADQIRTIEKEQAEAIPIFLADIADKEKNYLSAKAAAESAWASFQSAKAALSTENYNYSYSISHLEQTLTESADPALDIAKEYFQKKLEWLRSPGRISHSNIGAARNIFTETVTITQETNIPAINQALSYCQAAIQELETMKLAPELDFQKIEAMEKAIPSINTYSENTAEKPMEGSKSRSFASYFKSADQTNYEVSKLLEKAKGILSAPK